MSAEIHRFPIIPRPRPIGMYEDDPGVKAISDLRRAIQTCLQLRGRKATAMAIAQEFHIPDPFDWRTRARNLITGDKS